MTARVLALTLSGLALAGSACGAPASSNMLIQERTIALPGTSGRIDHLDIDLGRRRLFVAELGNGSVDVLDLATGRVVHRILGLKEPQGVSYSPKSDRLVVACGDGRVHIYQGGTYATVGVVKLDDDADNTRLDPTTGNVIVGHGSGGLAIIDPVRGSEVADIRLTAHPEGFQLRSGRAFINVPDDGSIQVADLRRNTVAARWPTAPLSGNFPVILDDAGLMAVVFRGQDRLALLDPSTGHLKASLDTCLDADDVFFDHVHERFYVSCGSGMVDVIASNAGRLTSAGRASTSWGARTSLFVPELQRLFVAERANMFGSDAAIVLFRPTDFPK